MAVQPGVLELHAVHHLPGLLLKIMTKPVCMDLPGTVQCDLGQRVHRVFSVSVRNAV